MGNFFAELKRRHVYRVGAAYAVIAWLLLQLFNNVAPILESPAWVGRVLLLFLVTGFPIALLLAWTFEATLAGIKRDMPASTGVAIKTPTTTLDYVLAGALILMIGLVSYEQLRTQPGSPETAAGTISLAVLPFANLSGDASQEFFSDGMTEEITAALAKIPTLQVVARTSAFEFKGLNRNVQEISRTLHAGYIIEGSVRKAGDRLRITAQLIRADTGAHLWTENYDRQLTDVFAVQEDIAEAIASALRAPLGLKQGESLVANRTSDLDSYQEYLRARALYRARKLDDATNVLETLVARDPNYAPAWGLLAETYVLRPADRPERAEKVAREAIRLDARNAVAFGALGDFDSTYGRWAAGEDSFRKALALDPYEPDVLNRFSARLAVSGRIKEALSLMAKLRTIEPYVPTYNSNTARFMVGAGESKAAITLLEKSPADELNLRTITLARAYAAVGRYGEAADTILQVQPRDAEARLQLEDAARILRTAPAKPPAPEVLPAFDLSLNFVYVYVGALDRVLDSPERSLQDHLFGPALDVLWQPEAASVRKTERFKKFVRNAGLVDYWRAKGWADACHPVGADDFACE